jgi:hypothetical protein
MNEDISLKINPNVADEKTLELLPGIGSSLAKKIIDSRPYSKLEDLAKVRGIGKSVIEGIAPMIVFEESKGSTDTVADEEVEETKKAIEIKPGEDKGPSLLSPDGKGLEGVEPLQQTGETEQEPKKVDDEKIEKKVEVSSAAEATKKPRLVKAFSRSETIWIIAGAGALSVILSILFCMIILGEINGTLDFNQLQGLKQLESKAGILEGDLKDLSSSLDALDQRLTPLEGLTGRMTSVEDLTAALQSDMEDALTSVESMRSELEDLSNETTRLSGRVDRFDTFLDGLRSLLNEVLAAPSAESSP